MGTDSSIYQQRQLLSKTGQKESLAEQQQEIELWEDTSGQTMNPQFTGDAVHQGNTGQKQQY